MSYLFTNQPEEQTMQGFEFICDKYEDLSCIPDDVFSAMYEYTDLLLVSFSAQGDNKFRVLTLPNNSYLFEKYVDGERATVSISRGLSDGNDIEEVIRRKYNNSDCPLLVYDGWGIVESFDTPKGVAHAVKTHFTKSKTMGLIPEDAEQSNYTTEITYEEERGYSVNHWVMDYNAENSNMTRYITDIGDGEYGHAVTVDCDWSIPKLCAYAKSLTELRSDGFEETEDYYERKIEQFK